MLIVKPIGLISFVLAFTAGFCDTTTFTVANQLFSAHVTGNLIVFAYDLVNRTDSQTWLKLISFPTFVFSVLFAGWIGRKQSNMYVLILVEGMLLLFTGCIAFIL